MRKILIGPAMALLLSSACAEPVVYWASDPVGGDDTAALSGAELDGVRSVEVTRLADDDRAAGPTREIAVSRATPSLLEFVLPADLTSGVYAWSVPSKGLTGLLNAPTVYWTQGDLGTAASVGGWVRVMGRNILRAPSARLEFARPGAPPRQAPAREGDLWDAAFAVPADLTPGTWTLTLSSGQGGARARRQAGTIEVRARPTGPSAVLNLRDFGARGDGKTDDGRALEKTLDAATHTAGGAVVFFPRGYYRLSRPVTIPDGIVLSGESRETTFLEWEDEAPPPALLSGYSHFTVQNLTIVAGRHFDVIHGGFPRPGDGGDGEDITLRNLRIRANDFLGHLKPEDEASRQAANIAFARNGVDSIGLAGRNLVVENCDVIGSGRSLYLLRPHGARIEGNSFGNGRQGWYSLSGADGVIFAGNEIFGADLESTGGGVNTLFARVGYSMHVLVKNNHFRRFLGWDREAMTTDGPGGFYFGAVSTSGGAALTLSDAPTNRNDYPDWRGAGVFVLSGAGTGEWARVVARQGAEVQLDRPLPTPPDATSLVSIAPMQGQHLFLNNDFEDAAYAVQMYGSAFENVVAGNRSSRTEGFFVKALNYQHIQPTWYNQVLNNEIREPGLNGPAYIGLWGDQKDFRQPLAMNLLTIVRGNRLGPNSEIQLRGLPAAMNPIRAAIVERNIFQGAAVVKSVGAADAAVRANSSVMPRLEAKTP